MDFYFLYNLCTFKQFHIFVHFFVGMLFLELIVCFFKKERTIFINFFTSAAKQKKLKIAISFILVLFTSLIILGSNPQTYILLGNKDIRLMPKGTYCRYVYAELNNKTYTLPAKITKYHTDIETGSFVKNVYFKNGGYLYFEDSCNLFLTKKSKEVVGEGIDQQEREWSITVTNKIAEHEKVITTNYKKSYLLMFSLFEIIVLLISFIKYYYQHHVERN